MAKINIKKYISLLLNNLYAYWELNNNTWTDSSQNNYTLTNINNVTNSTGIINNGASFSGVKNGNDNTSGNYLTNSAFNLEGQSAISISVWVNLNDVSVNQSLLGQFTGFGPAGSWWLGLFGTNQATPGFVFILNNNNQIISSIAPMINTWYHIAATYDGSQIKLYINGNLENSLNISGTLNTYSPKRELQIGWDNSQGDFLNGKLDEIGIWTRSLSQFEISDLYNFGLGLTYPLLKSSKLNIKKAIAQNGKLKIYKPAEFNPLPLGDLKVWLDAKDLSTITKDGSNLVSQWSSKVGSINFTQSNNSLKPTYQSAGSSAINKDCLYFNATASYGGTYNLLSSPSSNFTSIGGTATLFAVARALYVGPNTNGTIIGQTNGSPYRRRLQMTSSTMFLQGTDGDYNGGNNSNLGEVNHVNQPLVLVGIAIKSDGTARHYIQSAGTMSCSNGSFPAGSYNFNGTLNRGLIQIAGAASNVDMLIGSAFDGGAENLKGEICEILIYNGTLSDSSFDQVVAGLKRKWGL